MFRYETHLHTAPVSRCAQASVRETLEFYKSMGYDGVFITNHFLDGNVNVDRSLSYEEQIEFYFSDYEEGCRLAEEIGIKVFAGVELSYFGTDFLIYGLNKEWYLSHPQIMEMDRRAELEFMMSCGALVIQAHPFREAGYIDHLRLFPRSVHGAEIINANRSEFENHMAALYAQNYQLLEFAGTDNHIAGRQVKLAGMCCEEPVHNELDFVDKVKGGRMKVFTLENVR